MSKNVAIDINGNVLKEFTSDEIKKIGESFVDDKAKLLAVLSERNGEMAVNIFGPPNRKVWRALKQAVESLDKALKANGK